MRKLCELVVLIRGGGEAASGIAHRLHRSHFRVCLMEIGNPLAVSRGTCFSEILLKVAKRNIPILISKSAPTDLGVKLANDLGVTLIGFVRGTRMNVYTNGWRIALDGK